MRKTDSLTSSYEPSRTTATTLPTPGSNDTAAGAANQKAPPGNNGALLFKRVIAEKTEYDDSNDGASSDFDAMVEESGDKSRPSERPEVTEPNGSNSGREGPGDSNGQGSNSETANEPSIIVAQPYVWTPQAAKFDTKQARQFYGVQSWPEVKKAAENQPPYIVDRLIPEQSLGIVVGQYGIGKSPLMVQLAQTLAIGGRKFLDQYETSEDPISTLYVDLENGPFPMTKIGSSIAGFLRLPGPPKESFIYSPNYGPVQNYLLSLEYHLNKMISECGFKFIIIDPLRAYCPKAEGKNPDAVEMIGRLRKIISEAKATILLVHHPRKPSNNPQAKQYSLKDDPHAWMEQASGAGALVQNVDFRVGLEQDTNGNLLMRSFVRTEGWSPVLHLARVHNRETGEPIAYRMEGGIDKLSVADRECFHKLGDTFTTGEAKKVTGKSSNPQNKWLEQLVLLGLIRKVKQGTWQKLTAVTRRTK